MNSDCAALRGSVGFITADALTRSRVYPRSSSGATGDASPLARPAASEAPRAAVGAIPTRPPSHLVERPPSERLAAALRVAVRTHVTSLDGVQQAVADYVRALRAHGEPPQVVLVSVKDLIRRTPASGAAPRELPGDWAGAERRQRLALADAVVRWAIDAYYESDAEKAPRRR